MFIARRPSTIPLFFSGAALINSNHSSLAAPKLLAKAGRAAEKQFEPRPIPFRFCLHLRPPSSRARRFTLSSFGGEGRGEEAPLHFRERLFESNGLPSPPWLYFL